MAFDYRTRALVAVAFAAAGSVGGCVDGDEFRITPVRWMAADIGADDRTVRLAVAGSAAWKPHDVLLRETEQEIGLTLRVRERQGPVIQILNMFCAEVRLPEPIGDRELVDDGPGASNPFGVSVKAASRSLKQEQLPCTRVPAVAGS